MGDRDHFALIFALCAVPGAIYLWSEGLIASPRWGLTIVCGATGIALIHASAGLKDVDGADARSITGWAGGLLLAASLVSSWV